MPRFSTAATAVFRAVLACSLALLTSRAAAQTLTEPSDFSRTLDASGRTGRFAPGTLPGGDTQRFGSLAGIDPGAGSTGFNAAAPAKKRTSRKGRAAPANAPAGLPTARIPVPAAGVAHLPPQLGRRGAPLLAEGSVLLLPPNVLPPRLRRVSALDPWDPVGLHTGAFYLRPAIEVTGGYDTNPVRTKEHRGSSLLIVSPEFHAASDWQRHSLTADLKGTYTTYGRTFGDDGSGANIGVPQSLDRPALDSRVRGRLDISSVSRLDGEGRVIVGTDNPGSPNVQLGLKRLPIVTTTGATLGYTQAFNRLELTGKGSFDRSVWQDSTLTDGSTSPNDDRNFNQVGYAARAAYELKPGLKPFAEVGGDTRTHDTEFDRSGFQRNSVGYYGKVGSTFELTRSIIGEAAIGYLERNYKDPSLLTPRGLTFDGLLIWNATALTTVTGAARSTVGESVVPGVSGSLSRDFSFRLDHAFRRWLVATAIFGYGTDDYVGSTRQDQRYSVSAALNYKMNRNVWLRGEVRHDWLKSTVPGAESDATIMLLGARLQQ